MREDTMEFRGWRDLIELIVACWIFASPFVLGFFSVPVAAASAILLGVCAFLVSQLGIAKEQPGDEWTNVIIAVALIASPWVLGYETVLVATINAVASGIALALFAFLAMKAEYAERRLARASTP